MSKKLLDVGPLELEVLGWLNSHGEQSVNDVQLALNSSGHDLAYTTVMTVLVRLQQKGMLKRRKEGRSFRYMVANRKGSSALGIFEKVRNSLFQSQRLAPILGLLESEDDLSRGELEELKKAIEERLKRS